MSDFRKYLEEQLKDPDVRELWEAWREMTVRQVSGTMALSGMDLTEEDKNRIRYICEHPDKEEAMLEELIRAINVGCMHPWMNYEPRTLKEILDAIGE